MNKASLYFAVCMVCLVAFVPCALAQVPAHIEYAFSGTGNLTTSPVVYSGSIDSGEPLLVGGTWELRVDDTGWPPDTDRAVRWNYIDATYFAPNYDAFSFAWTGVFNGVTTASLPTWKASSIVGDLVGTAVIQMTIQDFDFDQVIDPDERAFILVSGTIIVIKDGTGIWAGYCGLGSYSGFTTNPDPVNFDDDVVSGNTVLDIEDCSVGAETLSWGAVKQIYGE